MKVLLSTPTRFAAQIALLTLALLGAANMAAAQQPSQAQAGAIRSNCRSDYRAHCASVPTGGPEALQCLQKNVASLSPSCQQAVNSVGGDAPAAASPPPAPAPSPAPAATAAPAAPTPGEAATPPSKAQATVTPAAPPEAAAPAKPATATPAPGAPAKSAASKQPSKAQAAAIKSACQADYQPHCPSVPAGRAAAWSCLQANVASLSPPCQQAVYAATGAAPAKTAVAPASNAAAPAVAAVAPKAAAPVPLPPVVRTVTPRQVLFLLRTACGGDFRALCPGVPVGGGRVINCLQAKAASLSPNCQAALGALGR
jgi:hypothetical protein